MALVGSGHQSLLPSLQVLEAQEHFTDALDSRVQPIKFTCVKSRG